MPTPSNDKGSILVTRTESLQNLVDTLVIELLRREETAKHTAFNRRIFNRNLRIRKIKKRGSCSKREEPPPAQRTCSELFNVSVVIIYYFGCRAPPYCQEL